MKQQEECGRVCEREKSCWWDWLRSCPDWGLQQGSLSFVQLFPLQRLGGEVLWNHTITVNITTLWKHNWPELDSWEQDKRKAWSFTADTREDMLLCCGSTHKDYTNIPAHWANEKEQTRYLSDTGSVCIRKCLPSTLLTVKGCCKAWNAAQPFFIAINFHWALTTLVIIC